MDNRHSAMGRMWIRHGQHGGPHLIHILPTATSPTVPTTTADLQYLVLSIKDCRMDIDPLFSEEILQDGFSLNLSALIRPSDPSLRNSDICEAPMKSHRLT